MATVINNPSGGSEHTHESDSSSWVIGLMLLIIVVLFYGLPMLRGGRDVQVNNSVPAPQTQDSGSDVNLQIPDKVDVNVNNPQGQ